MLMRGAFMNPKWLENWRVLIGKKDRHNADQPHCIYLPENISFTKNYENALRVKNLYQKVNKIGEFKISNYIEAELYKLIQNAHRDVEIAFVNEISMFCSGLDVDVNSLLAFANKHPRTNLLKPGVGVGGHCIPVNPYYLFKNGNLPVLKFSTEMMNARPKQKAFNILTEYKDKNNILISADYSQIELRILAHLSKDLGLIEAFKNNKDIHTITASEIFNTNIEKITSEQRRYAKIINFGLIYGMGAFGLAKTLDITRSDAQNYIQEYFNKYPTVLQYMEESKQFAREHGYVETFFGRRLWLPEINSSNGLRKAGAERAAINAPMQGTAADLIKLAMIQVQQWIDDNSDLKGQVIMQVHDELVFEVPDNEVEKFTKKIPQIMQNVAKLDIPLIVEINAGENWEKAH